MSFTQEFSIPASHPSLSGHFPGHPIVPSVVILQQIEIVFQGLQRDMVISAWPKIKFLHPVLPGDKVEVKFGMKNNQQAVFKCVSANEVVVSGMFEYQRKKKE